MSMCCAAIRRRLRALKDKKVIVGGTALELGDRFSIPNGGDRFRSGAAGAGGRIDPAEPHAALDLGLSSRWPDSASLVARHDARLAAARRGPARRRAARARRSPSRLIAVAVAGEMAARSRHLAAPHRDRRLSGRDRARRDRFSRPARPHRRKPLPAHRDVARRRPGLHRRDHLITVWNPGAEAIFGYHADEMIGQPFDVHLRRRRQGHAVLDPRRGQACMALARRRGDGVRGTAQERRGVSGRGHASPAGRAPMAFSTARSCATSRCASAKPSASAISPNTTR